MNESSCMIRVENKEQLDSLQKEFPFVVKAFLSDNCNPCTALKPELERQCQDTDKLMPFKVVPTIHCPIEEKFCRDEVMNWYVDQYKKENGITGKLSKKQMEEVSAGVPVVLGQQTSDGKIHFSVLGNDQKLIDGNYSAIRSLINRTKENWVKESGKR